jgi:hypothetical protein
MDVYPVQYSIVKGNIHSMRAGQVIIFSIAILSGGTAAYRAADFKDPETIIEKAAVIVPAPVEKMNTVIVAAHPLKFGAELTANDLREVKWPAFAFGGDIMKVPDAARLALAIGHIANRDAQPAWFSFALLRAQQADIFLPGDPVTRGAADPVYGVGNFRVRGKGAVNGADFLGGPCPGDRGIGGIGIEDLVVFIGNQQSAGGGIGHELEQIITPRTEPEMQDPGGGAKKRQQADNGKHGQNPQHNRLGLIPCGNGKPDGAQRQDQGQDQYRPHPAARPCLRLHISRFLADWPACNICIAHLLALLFFKSNPSVF